MTTLPVAESVADRTRRDAPGDGATAASLKGKLAAILQGKMPVAAGCFHLVGLAETRKRLGADWDRVKDKVHQRTRRAIEKHISPRDAYFPNGPEDYVLVFAATGKTAAQLISANIAAEVQKELFGDSDLREISIRTVVGTIDGSLKFEKTTLGDVLAVAGAACAPSTSTASAAAQPSASGESAEDLASSVRYRPAWDVKREVISTYYSRSIKRDNLAAYAGDQAPQASTIAKLAQIDKEILRSGTEMLADLYRNKFRLRMSFPVGFETLAGQDRRRAYIELCRAIPENLRPLILFELVDLPAGVPNGRLAEFVALLRPYCGMISATVDWTRTDLSQYKPAGIGMVNAVIQRGADESALFAIMDRFAIAAGRAGLQTSVEGVTSSSLAFATKGAGIALISGDRVGKSVEVPEHMLRVTWMELYFGRQKA